jgi:hypothetical protein
MIENMIFIINILAIIVASYFVFATVAAILYLKGIIDNPRIMDIIASILITLFLIFMSMFIIAAIKALIWKG